MMTSTRCLVKVIFTAAFVAILVPKSCCKSIEEIDTVDDEISDHEKLRESGIGQILRRNRRDTDRTDEVSLASEDGFLESKRLSEDENEEMIKRGSGSRRRRRSRQSRRLSRSRRSRRTSRRSRGRRTRRRQRNGRRRSRRNGRKGSRRNGRKGSRRNGRKGSRKNGRKGSRRKGSNGGGFNVADHVQTGMDLVNTGMGIADQVSAAKGATGGDDGGQGIADQVNAAKGVTGGDDGGAAKGGTGGDDGGAAKGGTGGDDGGQGIADQVNAAKRRDRRRGWGRR
uniref:Aspartate, glycine, lysine and serine-rich protein-like isoform X6 n=1 Tax=Crassostrea virginica TaxID=6565 RepID=A0A8B8DPG5_CRAVI|nr:aspartate, glycine, lysine and serine-rich protein-like isoform X6 [Crassostrea virginica]